MVGWSYTHTYLPTVVVQVGCGASLRSEGATMDIYPANSFDIIEQITCLRVTRNLDFFRASISVVSALGSARRTENTAVSYAQFVIQHTGELEGVKKDRILTYLFKVDW